MSNEYDDLPKGVSWWADRFGRRPVRTTLQLVFGLAGCVLAVMAVLWVTGVVIAPWKATGDISQQKNSAHNQIAQQGQFSDDRAAFNSSLLSIEGAQMAVDQITTPTTQGPVDSVTQYQLSQQAIELRGNLSGAVSHCQNIAADYDSLATKVLSSDLEGVGFPASLDAKVCLETASDQYAVDQVNAEKGKQPTPVPLDNY